AFAREEATVLRGREQRAGEEARLAEDRATSLAAQVEAREALERTYAGFSPAVAAVMARRDQLAGVHGPLADYLPGGDDPARSAAIEAYLGPLLQAIVVEDLATARAIRTWFLDEWRDGGSLLLLPIQALHVAESQANGGAKDPSAWVDTLLPELLVIADDPLQELHPGAARVGSRGEVVDARGVVRLVSEGD